jgi:hypothetical protein
MVRKWKPKKATALCSGCGGYWTVTRTGRLHNHAQFNGCKVTEPAPQLPTA